MVDVNHFNHFIFSSLTPQHVVLVISAIFNFMTVLNISPLIYHLFHFISVHNVSNTTSRSQIIELWLVFFYRGLFLSLFYLLAAIYMIEQKQHITYIHAIIFRFNALLIDIITKIQVQNKNNQLFINRSLLNLKSIREDALGQKSYSTYTATGGSKSRSLELNR